MNMYRQSPCFNSLSHLCYVGKPLITCWPWECSSPSIHPSIHIYLNEGRIHIYIYILYTHTHLFTCSTLHSYRYTYTYVAICLVMCTHWYIYIYCSVWFSISLPASYYTIYTILHHYTLLLVRLMFIPLQLLVKSY